MDTVFTVFGYEGEYSAFSMWIVKSFEHKAVKIHI